MAAEGAMAVNAAVGSPLASSLRSMYQPDVSRVVDELPVDELVALVRFASATSAVEGVPLRVPTSRTA